MANSLCSQIRFEHSLFRQALRRPRPGGEGAAVWPRTREELQARQAELARRREPPWRPAAGPIAIGGCSVCFAPAEAGRERAWAGAALVGAGHVGPAVVAGEVSVEYEPGLMALREGPLLEAAVRALPRLPDVLIVPAAGRDHPRRAGLAVHLGAVLGLPTVGLTRRPLAASGPMPSAADAGSGSVLMIDGEPVAAWIRTRAGARPLVAHAGWRTSAQTAIEIVLASCAGRRWPKPIRQARSAARLARSRALR
ncbi:MAG: endonuclease V [Myxococcales bacterium]